MRARTLLPIGLIAALAACTAPEFPSRLDGAPYLTSVQEDSVVALSPKGGALTASELVQLESLARTARNAGAPRALVTSRHGPVAQRRAERAARALQAQGIEVSYLIDPNVGPILVSGAASRMAIPACPDWGRARLAHPLDPLLGNDFPARSVPLGCSVDASTAAMVARPSDLTHPPTQMERQSGAAAIRPVVTYRTSGPPPLPEPFRPGEGG